MDDNDYERIAPGLFLGPVDGLPEQDLQTLRDLMRVWADKLPGNRRRTEYFNAHERVRNLRIAVPDRLAGRLDTVVGWPAKAVKSLADLSVLQGIDAPADAAEAGDIARANSLDVTVPEAIVSAYKHSCAFLTVYRAPDGTARITPRSALMSSAVWDMEAQAVASAMTITSVTRAATGVREVTGLVLWLPGRHWTLHRDQGRWQATLGRQTWPGVSVVPIVHDPQLDRPFGRSRITRPLMSYTDMAIRTLVRQEATAEFYSAPHLWFLGAAPDAVNADKWSSLVNAINGISKDEDGDHPVMQQVAQASMQPHSDMLRTIAMLVSSETNIPVSDLGVTTENPSSAEAMAEAERKLTREADRQNKVFGQAVGRALSIAYCTAHDTGAAPDSWQQVRPVWQTTREISLAARADAYQKISASLPGFASSGPGLRLLGLNEDEIRELQASSQQQQTQSALTTLLTGSGGAGAQEGTGNDDNEAGQARGGSPEQDSPAGTAGAR